MPNIAKPTDYELDLFISPEEIKTELFSIREKKWSTISLSPLSVGIKEYTKTWYMNRYIYFVPLNSEDPTYITTYLLDGETHEMAYKALMTFLSSLSWIGDYHFSPMYHTYSEPYHMPMKYPGHCVSMLFPYIDRDYLIEPNDEKVRLALAFYREGVSTQNIFHKFLSFFKVINIIKKNGTEQINWINSQLENLSHDAQIRLNDLKINEMNIGQYLYKNGRCAIAHAGADPTADPDDLREINRLKSDLKIIKELAKIGIEKELGVKSPRSQDKESFANKLLATVLQFQTLDENQKKEFPGIKLHIRDKLPNKLTQELYIKECNTQNNIIAIDTITPDQRAIIRFTIHPEDCDIQINADDFDCQTSVDDDHTHAEIEYFSKVFIRDYWFNGQIRVYDFEGNLLGKGLRGKCPNLVIFRSSKEVNQEIENSRIKMEAQRRI